MNISEKILRWSSKFRSENTRKPTTVGLTSAEKKELEIEFKGTGVFPHSTRGIMLIFGLEVERVRAGYTGPRIWAISPCEHCGRSS